MSDRRDAPIQDWRDASALTREAHGRLRAKFLAHLHGGPRPTADDVERVRASDAAAAKKLQTALRGLGDRPFGAR